MRLITRGVAGVLVLFGIIGLLFGLEISDIERGQTQAICGAVVLVGGVLAYLVTEVMARLDALLGAVTTGQPQAQAQAREQERAQERAHEQPHREAIAPPVAHTPDDVAPDAGAAEQQPRWEPQPQSPTAWAAPSWPAPAASTDHVDAAMAAVAAALGTAEEDTAATPLAAQARPTVAPEPRETTRPGLAAVFGGKSGLEPTRRPSLFERARAERSSPERQERQEPPAPSNPFTPPRPPFGGGDPFAPPADAAPASGTPVLNLRPSLAPEPAPTPEQQADKPFADKPFAEKAPPERPRPSLRALAASRSRDETISGEAQPSTDAAERAPEKSPEKPPERPPLPRDIFHRTIAREETGGADLRLRERLAALRGETIPAPQPAAPAPAPIAAPTPAPATTPTDPSEEVIGRYESNGSTYVMYADGTIEAETETGVFRFGSLDELKAYIEGGGK